MKFATVLIFVATLLAVLLELATSKTIFEKQPKEALRQLLDEHDISLGDDDLHLMRKYSYKRTTPSALTPSACELDYCKIPEDKNVVVLKNNATISFDLGNDIYNILTDFRCQPKKMFVRVVSGPYMNPFPSYVSVHRCIGLHPGSIVDHAGYHCRVKEKEEIKIKYFDTESFQYQHSTMYNHTKCTYECVLRQEDCKVDQTLDYPNCDCKCNLLASQCNIKTQYFDAQDCECKCKPNQACNNKLMQRNKNCQCECDPRIKQICHDHNLGLDSNYCTCI